MGRRLPTILLAIFATSCTNPFSVGPGRVNISLDNASVGLVESSILSPQFESSGPFKREVLRLEISSKTDLLKYFSDYDREIQVRCSVDGNRDGRKYSGLAVGPIAEGYQMRSGRYRYKIYSFVVLHAKAVEYEGGKPVKTISLKTSDYEALRCHLLGVTKAPVLFPRSNDVTVSAESFRALSNKAASR